MNQKIILYISVILFVISITGIVIFSIVFQRSQREQGVIQNGGDMQDVTRSSVQEQYLEEQDLAIANSHYNIKIIDEPKKNRSAKYI